MSRPSTCRRLAILGGSSPFTAALVDALVANSPRLPAFELLLQGRTTELLRVMKRYAEHHLAPLGWTVGTTTGLDAALAGADIVIHQNRYGGLDGRADDEELALQHGISPDETLGPASCNALLRMLPELRQVGRTMARVCPDAWILNLTNPLSAATSVLSRAGVVKLIGICELPLITVRRAAALLGLPEDGIAWSYSGLNHRGFVVTFEHDGNDCVERLVDRIGQASLDGVPATEIRRLRSIPTKYFALLAGNVEPRGGRALALKRLRDEIAADLERSPDRSPAGLQRRYMEWYPASVVPMIAALTSSRPRREVVNTTGIDGITREQRAWVSAAGVTPEGSNGVNGPVAAYLTRFELHEKAILDVAERPTFDAIRCAAMRDPLVPADRADAVARSLWTRHRAQYGA